jgi:hypothetical protein
MAKRIYCSVLLAILCLCLVTFPATAFPGSELWEYYYTGVDSSYEVYGNIWYGQTFTIDPESHTVAQIGIVAYREGLPGTVTLSIRATDDSGLPTGVDLASGTFVGDTITTNNATGSWYGVAVTEESLSYNVTYAIIVRAEVGDADNSLHVMLDGSSAAYAGGSVVTSDSAGLDWATDDDDDIYFRIYGSGLLEVMSSQVFSGYAETDDMLFVMQYYNVYVPYYPNADSNYYFTLQLRSANGATIIAQTTCRQWGYKPGAIYLSAASASGLTEGTAYRLYVYGSSSEQPLAYYTLTSSDWRGTDLSLLDTWVITQARSMEVYYDVDLTITTSEAEELNEEGGVIFASGIPGLQYIRPDLFSTVISIPGYDPEDWTDSWEGAATWQEMVGTSVAAAFTSVGEIFGVSGRNIGAYLILIAYLALSLTVVIRGQGGGSATVAGILAIPFIMLGVWLHLIDFAIIAIIASIGTILLVYRFWWSRT